MLTGLRLENIALIDALDLSFDAGFTVLTGETGAGKSLLLDALDALLGGAQGSQGARLLRPGCGRGRIEAAFSLTAPLRRWLERQQLEMEDGDLLVSREWRQVDERIQSRSRVNGVAVNRSQLLELRPLLLDLTVQGQTQQLALPGQQRRWLDRSGGSPLQAALETAAAAHRRWKAAAAALERALADRERLEREREGLARLLTDLEAARLEDPLELNRLEIEQDRLAHAVRLQQGATTLIARLQEGAEDAPSALDHLAACEQELMQMEALDPSVVPLRRACAEGLQLLQDLARELDRYGAALESDPDALEALQERMAVLKGLERRHGQDLAALIDRRDRLREQLGPVAAATGLAALEAAELAARRERDRGHAALTDCRREAARALEQRLMEALRPMGLANVRFAVAITPAPPGEEGADAVGFLFSANPGQPPAPLREVASGGEMSRFLLALKTCLAAADPDVTLLFDEIDSGVSGRVSGAIGSLLRRLGEQRQVFCVTHQPLVAAAAQHHFQVSKRVEAGRTLTRVTPLREAGERERELAELAGGDSGETRSYAASLLERGVA